MRKRILAGAGALAATAVLTLTGASPAFASTASKVTGTEVVTGAAHGAVANSNDPHIPLTFVGVVKTTDKGFTLGTGNSNKHTLVTPVGKLGVTGIGKPGQKQTINTKTCYVTFTETQKFTFTAARSTGKFKDASGPGAYRIFFAAYEPRYTSGKHKGECNFNANPVNKGAVVTFLAAGVLTVHS